MRGRRTIGFVGGRSYIGAFSDGVGAGAGLAFGWRAGYDMSEGLKTHTHMGVFWDGMGWHSSLA